jgi:hypothetical protein
MPLVSFGFNAKQSLNLDSNHKLLEMLVEFQPDGKFFKYLSDDLQTIDFNGFKNFINSYFGAELPADLTQQLFLSFAQPTSYNSVSADPIFSQTPPPEPHPQLMPTQNNTLNHVSERRASTSALEGALNTVKQAFGNVGSPRRKHTAHNLGSASPSTLTTPRVRQPKLSYSSLIPRRFLPGNNNVAENHFSAGKQLTKNFQINKSLGPSTSVHETVSSFSENI